MTFSGTKLQSQLSLAPAKESVSKILALETVSILRLNPRICIDDIVLLQLVILSMFIQVPIPLRLLLIYIHLQADGSSKISKKVQSNSFEDGFGNFPDEHHSQVSSSQSIGHLDFGCSDNCL